MAGPDRGPRYRRIERRRRPRGLAGGAQGIPGQKRLGEMFKKIDADGHGKVTRDEFVNYKMKIFDIMDVKKTGMVGAGDFITRK